MTPQFELGCLMLSATIGFLFPKYAIRYAMFCIMIAAIGLILLFINHYVYPIAPYFGYID